MCWEWGYQSTVYPDQKGKQSFFSDIQKLKESDIKTRDALQEMLKDSLQTEGK